MLSHRSGVPTPRRGLVERSNNENAQAKSLAPVNDASHKTPARSVGKRRAFGDISNRKQQSTQPHHDGSRKPSTTATKKTVSFQTPHRSSVNPSKKPVMFPRSVAFKTENPFAEKNVDFILPRPTPANRSKSTAPDTELESSAAVFLDDEEIDDVEMPAGRLWKDQHNDDFDDETTISIEGLQSYPEILQKRWEYEERARQRQVDMAEEKLEQEIQAMWKQEDEDLAADMWRPQDGGFENSMNDLLDTMEGFELSLKNNLGDRASCGLDDDISI